MTAVSLLALGVWLYLCFAHGSFWRSSPELLPMAATDRPADGTQLPPVDIVVPARDEAQTIARVVSSLLAQDYAGSFRIILIDDGSSDGTALLAGSAPNLSIISAPPKPEGWSGKLWAVNQGVEQSSAPMILFADADIVHDRRHLSTLVARLIAARLDLVSEMVRLNCDSWAERALIPAFVYFFQMLYPFRRVNDPAFRVAAAAGGTVLVRRDALRRIGGIGAIKHALIDDVTLARAVKRGGPIFLGHSGLAESIRPYLYASDIWNMVARTAFTQLRHSLWLLLSTLLGLALVWWAPLLIAIFAAGWHRAAGACAYVLSAMSYLPTLKRYGRNRLWALWLPVIAGFFMTATVGSAWRYWQGTGARWKDRAYERAG